MAVKRMLFILCSLHVECTVSQSVSVTVATDKAIATIDDHFVGVTFESTMLPISANWYGLDFGSPKVQTLAKALSPCYLRIGGTPGDFMTFDPTGHGGTSPNATYTGWDLVFGLNVLKRKDGQRDPTNAQELMKYSHDRNYKIPEFELGNEPSSFPKPFTDTISGAQLGRDCLPEYLVMDGLITDINIARNVTNLSNPDTPLWLGETSSFYGGGTPGVSDRYVAGFLWLDKLGIAARMGLKGVLRQSYFGKNYSLIEMNTFEPYPDYWLTLLYKRLVGFKVLSVQTNSTNSFRVYAHCAKQENLYRYKPGSVVAYIVNVNNFTTAVTFPQFKTNMDVFWLQPAFPDLTSRNVTLNGKRLDYVNDTIPEMPPERAYGGSLQLPATTFGFVVFPDAGVGICK
ncbi:heparanase-like [Haliotis rubra]|uniref:heparanase-like n=1 Tax=Haliotis rubra TaxID=36100 RepID=UPI001EE5DF97|nr:heparanase-like [Haliotis rubra]